MDVTTSILDYYTKDDSKYRDMLFLPYEKYYVSYRTIKDVMLIYHLGNVGVIQIMFILIIIVKIGI